MTTKKTILLLFAWAMLFAGCRKETLTVYNSRVVPDLSNPIIQKLTNITWTRIDQSSVGFVWNSLENIPKPSEAAASLMYSMAWLNFTLYRDGTVNMLYQPPVFSFVFLHCHGTWTVSKTEENTIVINTDTPISSAIIKMKVLNLEIKDNLAILEATMDLGNYLLKINMNNGLTADPYRQYYDYGWFAEHPVSSETMQAQDMYGAWATPGYNDQTGYSYLTSEEELPYLVMRSTHITDLFAHTPNFFSGVKFIFEPDGKAFIVYGADNFFEGGWGTDRQVYSEASYYTLGNKLVLETDEDFFWSVGEILFSFPATDPQSVAFRGYLDNQVPVYTQSKRFYIFEPIAQEAHGIWCRITSNDANYYGFLFRIQEDLVDGVNIKEVADL